MKSKSFSLFNATQILCFDHILTILRTSSTIHTVTMLWELNDKTGFFMQREQALNQFRIQQKINQTDIQHAVVVVPAFADILADNDFREGIAGQSKRP